VKPPKHVSYAQRLADARAERVILGWLGKQWNKRRRKRGKSQSTTQAQIQGRPTRSHGRSPNPRLEPPRLSRSFNNASLATDPNNVQTFSTCDLVIGLVGRNVQPFEGKQKDANGWTTNMWSVGSTLALRSWHDEHTRWRQDEFLITSVTKNAPAHIL